MGVMSLLFVARESVAGLERMLADVGRGRDISAPAWMGKSIECAATEQHDAFFDSRNPVSLPCAACACTLQCQLATDAVWFPAQCPICEHAERASDLHFSINRSINPSINQSAIPRLCSLQPGSHQHAERAGGGQLGAHGAVSGAGGRHVLPTDVRLRCCAGEQRRRRYGGMPKRSSPARVGPARSPLPAHQMYTSPHTFAPFPPVELPWVALQVCPPPITARPPPAVHAWSPSSLHPDIAVCRRRWSCRGWRCRSACSCPSPTSWPASGPRPAHSSSCSWWVGERGRRHPTVLFPPDSAPCRVARLSPSPATVWAHTSPARCRPCCWRSPSTPSVHACFPCCPSSRSLAAGVLPGHVDLHLLRADVPLPLPKHHGGRADPPAVRAGWGRTSAAIAAHAWGGCCTAPRAVACLIACRVRARFLCRPPKPCPPLWLASSTCSTVRAATAACCGCRRCCCHQAF